ncbi:helix-turn-helix transcriptional regulator [Rhodanobacter soli]
MATKAETLREMRLQKRLTQAEVAERLKVSQGYYSAVEQGKKPGELSEAMKLVNKMRLRGDRTEGGEQKAGRQRR